MSCVVACMINSLPPTSKARIGKMKKLFRQLYFNQSCFIDYAWYMFATALIKRSSYWKRLIICIRWSWACPPLADNRRIDRYNKKSSSVSQKSFQYVEFQYCRSFYLTYLSRLPRDGVGTLQRFFQTSMQVVKASSGHFPLPFLISEIVKERAQR